MIRFEKEITHYFKLPQIPTDKHLWDGESSFKDGIAIVKLALGEFAYAACTFDNEKDESPRIVKTFAMEAFYGIEKVYVVPAFMDTNVDEMDLDEESKKAAELLAQEVNEMTQVDDDEQKDIDEMQELPEWIFPEITNKEQAIAWLRQYNTSHKIKGRVPENEETLKLRLLNIHSQLKEKEK